jgi:hypothetical protein
VKSRLKKFISRRPSLKTLQEKGLIKGTGQCCFAACSGMEENIVVQKNDP